MRGSALEDRRVADAAGETLPVGTKWALKCDHRAIRNVMEHRPGEAFLLQSRRTRYSP
jgi:hypothetical protein